MLLALGREDSGTNKGRDDRSPEEGADVGGTEDGIAGGDARGVVTGSTPLVGGIAEERSARSAFRRSAC